MICVKNLDDIKIVCRICLTQSENMICMDNKLDESEGSPLISDVLENILSVKINEDTNYPRDICNLCHGNIRILFDLKHMFLKSQRILEKYISTLESEEYISLFASTSQGNSLIEYCEDEDSKMSAESDYNYDLESIKSDIMKIDDNESLLQEHSAPNIIKVEPNNKARNAVRVKWIEGNKFVIEKNENTPRNILKMLHKCTYCHKRFLTKEKLKIHLTSCKKYVVVKCEFCNNKFSSLARKEHHIKLKHTSVTPKIKCEICDMTFKNHNARSYHKLTRHSTEGKKYKCELCGKAFYIKNSLNQHLECHSRDVSKVVCPICGKGFHYRGGLFYHMKIHRNERNYICSFCNRRFLTMASLKRHTRIHTGERPYSCSLCSKTFCSVGEVKTHERRHTGQKPYPCKYCSKRFISPYNLKLHISSHAGTVPCDFCAKCFLNSEALKYHMDIKHNIRDKKPTIEKIV